jgi:hypothetical protein
MPIVNDGDEIALPFHKVARVAIEPPVGTLTGTTFRPSTSKPVFEVGAGEKGDEVVLIPLALGTSGLEITTDGDPGAGTLPLRLGATVRVYEGLATSLALTYTIEGELPQRLPELGSEADLPMNRTARIEVIGIGVHGEPVPLTDVEFQSGNEARFTVTPDPLAPHIGILTPVELGAFTPLAISANGDTVGTSTLGATVQVSVVEEVATSFETEYELEDPEA